LKEAFARADEVATVVGSQGGGGLVPLEELVQSTGLDAQIVLDALVLLHMVGAASVDLRSWEQDAQSVARVIEICPVIDRDERLAAAVAAGRDRARSSALKLEALRRYGSIERSDDLDGADPYQAYLERYLTEADFLDLVAAESTDDLVAPLNEVQRSVVQAHAERPIVILAGPGSGKTRTLVSRIAYRVRAGYVLPERVLAVTFTRAATEEMRARLAQLGVRGVDVRTLDSLGWKIVRENWAAMGFQRAPSLLEKQHEYVAKAEVTSLNLQKNRCVPLVHESHLAYQARLEEENLVDFGDVKSLATKFLLGDRGARRYTEGLDEVYVDEFQDLSPLQIRLVDAISADAHLTVVGDPRQAIYEWNGASPEALLARARQAGGQSFDLVESYRSTAPILALANRIIAATMPGLPPMTTTAEGSAPAVHRHHLESEEAMLDHVAVQVEAWLDAGVSDAEIAVLAYKNSTVARVSSALRRRGITAHEAGLPPVSKTHAFTVLKEALATDEVADPDESPCDVVDRLRRSPSVETALVGPTAEATAEYEDDWERVRAAVDENSRAGAADLADALHAIRTRVDGPQSRSGVTLTTMTRAKGLEWTAVAVTDLGADAMADFANDDEKCRLLYVAVTRARTHLNLSWTGAATKWLPG
jgi:DNA helicase-2/ATP-dependent DNA helicase PcrA